MVPRSLLGAEVAVGRVEAGDRDVGRGGRIVADRRSALVHLPGLAAFAVEDGERVVVDVAPGASEEAVSFWLQGAVAALLLAQRGRFALHANVVEIRGLVIALAGASGAGKSTTSLRLAQRGGALVGDDVLPIATEGSAVVCATTARPLRIDPTTAARLEWDVADALPHEGKLLLPRQAAPPGPLHHVVELVEAPVAAVEMTRLSGADAVRVVRKNAYRARLLGGIWRAELFAWAAALADRVPVHVVRRPAGRWSVDEVAAAIEGLAL
jgi:hypothetical protein